MTTPLTPEEENDVRARISSIGYTPFTIGRERLANLMKFGENKARRVLFFLRGSTTSPNSPPTESDTRSYPSEKHERQGDHWTIELRGTRIKTLEEMLMQCQVDLERWEVEQYVIHKWEMGRKEKTVDLNWIDGLATGSVEDTGRIFVEPLFLIRVWLKEKVQTIAARDEIAALKELAKISIRKKSPKQIKTNIKQQESPYLLELSLPDVHIGRLARGDETGWDNYDSDIAKELFNDAVRVLIERTRSFIFRQIVFIVGNDILNADNLQGTTTHGTPQANDSRYHKVFGIARNSLIDAIELLRQIANVKVVVLPGNHDILSAWHLGDSLEAYFHTYSDVTIDNTPAPRKYHQFGDVMLVWMHGDRGKKKDYPLMIDTEQPVMFGSTRFREIHIGHKHSTSLDEQHGIRVRILPSLAAPDSWSSEMGFVGAIRGAEAYVWHRNQGLVNMAFYTVSEKFARLGSRET